MDISSGVIKHGKLVSLGDGNMFTEVESHLHIVTLKVDDTQWVGASHWDRKPGAQQFWEPRGKTCWAGYVPKFGWASTQVDPDPGLEMDWRRWSSPFVAQSAHPPNPRSSWQLRKQQVVLPGGQGILQPCGSWFGLRFMLGYIKI